MCQILLFMNYFGSYSTDTILLTSQFSP
uniref:Uncharacterized protein n=1 Tax=Arundo donax TaxID=35708 RepID=A0A0A9HA40_ARUDO